jgi:NAD(P)-dependent dehydrogenase (short-subunit alcohol dehydrogenase family)
MEEGFMGKLDGKVGSNGTGVQGDVAKLGDLDRLFEQIKRDKGKLDIVFANAGIAKNAPLGTIDEEHFDTIFGINVKGLLFFGSRQQRTAGKQRLFGDQGCCAVFRAYLDH